ncbi:MAG TPA: hypothetical protein VGK74_17360 [Symbiobacteriaceae bacterium]
MMLMPQLSAREILDAIRKLSEAERRSLIDELISEDFTESTEDIAAIQEGLDQAERGQLIGHEDLSNYMATRRKERRRA